jgi:hypothetical protein
MSILREAFCAAGNPASKQQHVLNMWSSHISWEMFRRSMAPLRYKPILELHELHLATRKFDNPITFIELWCRGLSSMQFRSKLEHAQDAICSDPRDRIYAMLSIHEQAGRSLGIRPDSNSPVTNVFRNATLQMMKHFGDLNVSSSAKLRDDTNSSKTSRIPDFSLRRLSTPVSNALAGGRSFPLWKSPVDDVLRVTGNILVALTVRKSSQELSGGFTTYSLVITSIRQLRIPRHLNAPYAGGDTATVLDAYCDALISGTYAEMSVPLGFFPAYQTCKEILRKILVSTDDYDDLARVHKEALVDFLNSVQTYCRSRTIFTTNQGYVGIGPQVARAGDHVLALLGLNSCMLLRPVDNGRWHVVGECYVSGMMAGEALSDLLWWVTGTTNFWNRKVTFRDFSVLEPKAFKGRILVFMLRNTQRLAR